MLLCFDGTEGYSQANFPVEMGQMAIGKHRYDVYEVSPAEIDATEFVASKGTLVFKLDTLPSGGTYKIYKVTETSPDTPAIFEELDELTPVADQFVLSSVEVYPLAGPTAYIALPSDLDAIVSSQPSLSPRPTTSAHPSMNPSSIPSQVPIPMYTFTSYANARTKTIWSRSTTVCNFENDFIVAESDQYYNLGIITGIYIEYCYPLGGK